MSQQSTQYGKRQGDDRNVIPVPVAASEVFKKKGGAFTAIDANGRVTIAVAATTNVMGHALFNEDFTASSTAGGTTVPVDFSYDSIYELPINTGTWNDNMVGTRHGITVASSIQGVDLTDVTNVQLIILGKGTTNAAGTVVSVLAKMNPNAQVPRTT